MASEGKGWGQGRARAEESGTKRGKIGEGGTLDPLLGCLPHTADPDAAPANPRRATCVNKRIESVLVTWSSVLSSRFSSTVPLCFTSLQLIPPPYHFLSLSTSSVFRSVSLQVFLLLLEVLHGRWFTRLLFSNFIPLSFSISRYVNRPVSVSNSAINWHAVTRNTHIHNLRDLFLILKISYGSCAIFMYS